MLEERNGNARAGGDGAGERVEKNEDGCWDRDVLCTADESNRHPRWKMVAVSRTGNNRSLGETASGRKKKEGGRKINGRKKGINSPWDEKSTSGRSS